MAAFIEEHKDTIVSGVSGGLSQAELDELCLGQSDDEDMPSPGEAEDFDDLLLKTKRTRHFFDTDHLPQKQLSQGDLDALGVNASEDGDQPLPPDSSEDFLFRVRRTRHFLGDEAADAFVKDIMSKTLDMCTLEKEASDEMATTATSGSLSPPTGGMSQAELDAFCHGADADAKEPCASDDPGEMLFQARRRRHFMGREQADAFISEAVSKLPSVLNQDGYGSNAGLSQEELDALGVCEEDASEPEDSDTVLLRVRRARHFLGEKVGQPSGLSQEELDSLAVSAEDDDEPQSPKNSAEAFLLRLRRARHFKGDEAADALVSEEMAKSSEVQCKVEEIDDDAESVSTKSGSLALTAFTHAASSRALSRLSTRALSQAELDDLCVSASDDVEEPAPAVTTPPETAPASTTSSKVRSKVQGISIETELDDLAVRLEQVATPTRKRFSPTRGSPRMSFSPSSPQHA